MDKWGLCLFKRALVTGSLFIPHPISIVSPEFCLKIDGKALIPEEFGRGRYERGR
jgi:hypothetical protein